MILAPRRRTAARTVVLDRALERLPLFRLSDSADDSAVSCTTDPGGRWRALPSPGDRLPGTFDQDVYVELLHRFQEAGAPEDGALAFTLHAFLRSMGRKADGRTYEQLRSSLTRLERTTLESHHAYRTAEGEAPSFRFSVLTSVVIERRRRPVNRSQLALFPSLASGEPGEARVTLSSIVRGNLAAGHTSELVLGRYLALGSPVARRLYRLLAASDLEPPGVYRTTLDDLAERLPLTQRFPSHLLRVIHPAHDQLVDAGVVLGARSWQEGRVWMVEYQVDVD